MTKHERRLELLFGTVDYSRLLQQPLGRFACLPVGSCSGHLKQCCFACVWRRNNKHVTPLLRDKLHWLRICERVQFKCCLLVYKALNSAAPTYIAAFCSRVAGYQVAHHCVLLLIISSSFCLESLSLAIVHFQWPDLPLGTCCRTTSSWRLPWIF